MGLIQSLNLNQKLELNLGLSLNQRVMLSMLKMDFTQLHEFLNDEFSKNPALEGELPSLITVPEFLVNHNVNKNSLKEDLLFQLHVSTSKSYHKICEYLIESLDTKGYLIDSEKDISQQLKVPISKVTKCLEIIQALDPAGIGARSLKECFLIQLSRLYPNDLIVYNLVENYLSHLLNKNFNDIIEKTSYSMEEIKEAFTILQTLNPIPGNGSEDNKEIQFITPDILLFDEGDELVVEMPSYGFERIKLNPIYTDPDNLLKYKAVFKEDLNRATTILKGLENRQSTLYQIGKIMIMKQYEYLKYSKPLQSLKLADIADELGVHESTISRGIDEKYILYNENLIPLKSLLSRGTVEGDSVDQIKQRLYFIIQNEDKAKPFSDVKIVQELSSYGINISRRTVAKYRSELKIESAANRKKQNLELNKC